MLRAPSGLTFTIFIGCISSRRALASLRNLTLPGLVLERAQTYPHPLRISLIPATSYKCFLIHVRLEHFNASTLLRQPWTSHDGQPHRIPFGPPRRQVSDRYSQS